MHEAGAQSANERSKLRRVEMCHELLLDLCREDPQFLDNVITGDESLVFEYDLGKVLSGRR